MAAILVCAPIENRKPGILFSNGWFRTGKYRMRLEYLMKLKISYEIKKEENTPKNNGEKDINEWETFEINLNELQMASCGTVSILSIASKLVLIMD